jgi:hypothetical protein
MRQSGQPERVSLYTPPPLYSQAAASTPAFTPTAAPEFSLPPAPQFSIPPTPVFGADPAPTFGGTPAAAPFAEMLTPSAPPVQAPVATGGYVPMAETSRPFAAEWAYPSATPTRSGTAALWLIAFLPIVHFLAIWLVIDVLHIETGYAVRYAIFGAPSFLYFYLAHADRAALLQRGYDRIPHALWAVLPPLYLIIRAAKVGTSSLVAMFVWLILETAAIAFLFSQAVISFGDFVPSTTVGASSSVSSKNMVAPFTAADRAFLLTPAGMAQKIAFDSAQAGQTIDAIACEQLSSVEASAQTECTASIDGVAVHELIQVQDAASDVPFAVVSVSRLT